MMQGRPFSAFAAASFQMQALNGGGVAFSFHEQADGLSDGVALSPDALALINDED